MIHLNNLRSLGRSGLLVSPLCLGTMTFATQRWGSGDAVSEAVFNTYVDAGGNFVDTADVYAGGRSEELTGQFIGKRNLRDKIVLATKCGFNGGNGRRNIYRSLENSLRRLETDYIDLYWMHVWDMITPVEEVLQTLGDLIGAGKIRYFAFSDTPAWYAAKAATLAASNHIPGPIALQLAYSLVERNIEHEHIPAARECGLGIAAWSPLAAGLLSGKYNRETAGKGGDERLNGNNPFGDMLFTDRNWKIVDDLRFVAGEMNKPMPQVALAWALAQPGITSLIIGASKQEQLQSNIASLEISLSDAHLHRLNESSALPPAFPYSIFNPQIKKGIFGGAEVEGWK